MQPALPRMRKNLADKKRLADLNAGGLKQQKVAALSILSESGKFPDISNKVKRYSYVRPCNSKWCLVCSNPKERRTPRYADKTVKLHKNVCNATGSKNTKRSSNYQVRAGQRMIEPFADLPVVLINCCTINLGLSPLDGNLRELVAVYRKRVRKALAKLSAGAIARGKFDMVLKYADELHFEIPNDELPAGLTNADTPEQLCGMVHIHLVIFDPNLSREDIREVLITEFPGKSRVRVEKSWNDIKSPDGTVKKGAQGFLEYASLEKIELKFGAKTKDAIFEFATLDTTWNRANRNFSYGKRPSNKSQAYDPKRVQELEALDRCASVKKNWKHLGYGKQFLHLWMYDAKTCLKLIRARFYLKTTGLGFTPNDLLMYLTNSLYKSNSSSQVRGFGSYFIDSGDKTLTELAGGTPKPVPP